MRYAKGQFVLSAERDIPLLRQVRNSRFITHAQLFEFMKLGGFDHDRDSFNWRLRRLRTSAHISVCPDVQGAGSAVYQITRNGLTVLEHFGECAVVLNSNTEHLPHLAQVFHAVELNAIHLALARKNLVAGWQSEVEIASYNTISRRPYQKDYDAIVDVWLGDRKARFALEYERSLKSHKHYSRIREALEAEHELDSILYITVGTEFLVPLVQELGPTTKKKLFFTSTGSFVRDLLDTEVIGPGAIPCVFREHL
jgi:hypothetical protein